MNRYSTATDRRKDVSLLVLTWNVGNKQPSAAELKEWLPEEGAGYDCIVVGTQENQYKAKKEKEHEDHEEEEEEHISEDEDERVVDRESESDRTPVPSAKKKGRVRMRDRNQSVAASPKMKAGASSLASTSMGTVAASTTTWETMILERLGKDWDAVAHVVLVGMRLTCYCSTDLVPSVHSVMMAKAATGVGGVYGNKGGLLARMTIGHTTIGFVCTHLAPHEGKKNNDARNAMCRRILLKTMGGVNAQKEADKSGPTKQLQQLQRDAGGGFGRMGSRASALKNVYADASVPAARGKHASGYVRKIDAAHDVDHLIWLGDLNYRVDLSNVDTAKLERSYKFIKGIDVKDHGAHVKAVEGLVKQEAWSALLEADQLKKSQKDGDAFVGFTEGTMAFAPTFKLKRSLGTTYNQKRTPSYTDRILWKSMPTCKEHLQQTELKSLPNVSTSDHKPVMSSFTLRPSPLLDRGNLELQAAISVTNLKLELGKEVTNFDGSVDAFCRFYTHPEGLIRSIKAPKTRVLRGQTGTAEWEESKELYITCPVESLKKACLLIAVYDHDKCHEYSCSSLLKSLIPPNTLLGVVTIPLDPALQPAAATWAKRPSIQKLLTSSRMASSLKSEPSKKSVGAKREKSKKRASSSEKEEDDDNSYNVNVHKRPIVLGHSTAGTGKLSCNLEIRPHEPTWGQGLMGRLFFQSKRGHTRAKKMEQEGNYTGAMKELEKTQKMEIDDIDVKEPEQVRSKVKDLCRLAEMKWRYQVVDVGESAHAGAMEALTKANELLDRHKSEVLGIKRQSTSGGGGGVGPQSPAGAPAAFTRAPSAAPLTKTPGMFRLEWAAELSAVLQHMCASRVRYNEGDNTEIENDLKTVIELREEAELTSELCESLVSYGLFKQKLKAYDDAETAFQRSLDLRRAMSSDVKDGSDKVKQQNIAQSLVSLGQLARQCGDECTEDPTAHTQRRGAIWRVRVSLIREGSTRCIRRLPTLMKG